MVAARCLQKLQGYEGTGVGYTGWIRRKIHDNFWVVTYIKQSPLLIIEILSSSTEAYDRGGKFAFYRQLTSLQEYVLIDPRTYRVDVFRRTPQNRWELINFEGADTEVEFASINFHCTMQAIYEDVDFELV